MRVGISSTSWQNLETLMNVSMNVGDEYQLQNVKNNDLLVCEGATEPENNDDGYLIKFNKWLGIKKESGVNIYVKSFNAGTIINIAKKGA